MVSMSEYPLYMSDSENDSEVNLSADIEELRIEDPVLWARIRGRASPIRIALLLGWPMAEVLKGLNNRVKSGDLVNPDRNGNWHFNRHGDRYTEFLRLQTYLEDRELENLLNYPIKNYKELKPLVTQGTWRQLSERGDELNRALQLKAAQGQPLLSKTSWENLELIQLLFDEVDDEDQYELFNASAYEKARRDHGYQVSNRQYTLNELARLESFGLLEHVEQVGKAKNWWRLTQFGVEYKNEPVAVDRAEMRTNFKLSRERVSSSMENPFVTILRHEGRRTTYDLAEARGITRSAAHKQLTRLLGKGLVSREVLSDGSSVWSLSSSPSGGQ